MVHGLRLIGISNSWRRVLPSLNLRTGGSFFPYSSESLKTDSHRLVDPGRFMLFMSLALRSCAKWKVLVMTICCLINKICHNKSACLTRYVRLTFSDTYFSRAKKDVACFTKIRLIPALLMSLRGIIHKSNLAPCLFYPC